jgi:predicted aspartyl protease
LKGLVKMKRNAKLAIKFITFAVFAFCLTPDAAAQSLGKNVRARTPRAESGNRAHEIPFELTERGHIFVPIRVNNSELLWFVLDSGSGSTLLNKRLIEKLNLKVVAVGEATGAGESADGVSLASGVMFDLSGVKLANQEVPAIDFQRLETFWGRNVDGLLGYDFIRRFVVEVDYEAHVLKIYKAAKYRYRGRGQSFPITTEDDHPHIRLSVTLPKRQPLEGKFIVDGGAGGATMEFASPFAKKHDLLRTIKLTETKSLPGIGGSVTISYGRGDIIRFGRFSIENPIVGFPQANRGAFANPNIAGLIGSRLLRRFTVIYDDRRRRIIFEPNSSFATPE